jgi:hypothetical protein
VNQQIRMPLETSPEPSRKWPVSLARLVESPVFSYLTILAIQLRAVWEFWSGRDLSVGDTSGYFTVAQTWAGSLKNVIFWSPLYTAYYGTVLKIVRDPVVTTLVHRMIVVFAVTLLVVAVTRRLLPASAAWLVSAWWAVLPINFDTQNEVHLFSFIPILVAVLLLASRPNHARRAAVLAIFGASTVLVRNEMVFATVAFGLFCLWALAAESRRNGGLRTFLRQLEPYVAGAAAAFLVVTFFYTRSTIQLPEAADVMGQRARLNFCQAYAFSYQQRNPDWPGNPFTNCKELMATFGTSPESGSAGPGFVEALRHDPGAVFDYLQWNTTLVPNGLQLALFSGTSRSQSPDYVPVPVNQTLPWVLSVICLLILLGGAWTYLNERRFWSDWISRRRWPLLALAAPSTGVLVVMVQQRPRPSYMFALTLLVMILIGFSAFALLRAFGAGHLLGAAVPLVALAALVAVPSPYTEGSTPLQDRFDRLEPHASELSTIAASVPGYREELCRYLSVSNCKIVDYWTVVRPLAEAGGALDAVLDQMEVGLFYADEAVLQDRVAAGLVGGDDTQWRRIAGSPGQWILLERVQHASRT